LTALLLQVSQNLIRSLRGHIFGENAFATLVVLALVREALEVLIVPRVALGVANHRVPLLQQLLQFGTLCGVFV
jgi:hypothetical protein